MNEENKEILFFALSLGELMLCNGGEIYRVEDMMLRICNARNISGINVFATPTVIMISYNDPEKLCIFNRINSRGSDLDKVSMINNLARKFTSTNMSLQEAKKAMEVIRRKKQNHIVKLIFAGIVASFYAVLFNGSIIDFFIAFILGVVSQAVYDYFNAVAESPFLSNILAGFAIGFFAHISEKFMGTSIDTIIIGAIMPFVPGLILTNAVRDFIYGDLLSGSSRFFEAILVGTSVAVGVSFGISVSGLINTLFENIIAKI